MDKGSLKNIVVLKNLPSNLVEEAIVILKTNKKSKRIQKVENRKSINEVKEKPKQSEYILKEAEMLISNYITGIEEKKDIKANKKKLETKYKRVKKYAYIVSIILFIQSILFFIK